MSVQSLTGLATLRVALHCLCNSTTPPLRMANGESLLMSLLDLMMTKKTKAVRI